MNIVQDVKKQQDHFKTLENKLKIVANSCSDNTLVRSDTRPYAVMNADRGEQHILENGLSVYIFYKDNQRINYWISTSPLLQEYEFTNQYGKHSDIKYSGGNAIEYTCGGAGNSLPMVANYYQNVQIGLVGNVNGKITKVADTVPTMAGGYKFDILSYSKMASSFFDSNNFSKLSECQDSCDIENYINNMSSNEMVDDLKICLSFVNEIVMKKAKSYEKRGLLKKLLNRYKSLSDEIDNSNSFGKFV